MKIRALTVFADLTWPLDPAPLDLAERLVTTGRAVFADAGIEVQTTRFASQPLERYLPPGADPMPAVLRIEAECARRGIEYVSLGPLIDRLDLAPALPELIARTQRVFVTVRTATGHDLSLAAVAASARVVKAIAMSGDGFGNLRFAAVANCPPGVPFFPGAYHGGGTGTFGIAIQAADLALDAFREASTIEDARTRLVAAIESADARLGKLAAQVAREARIDFAGIDWSLAPFPDSETSIGAAIEELGVEKFGGPGTLFGAALLTDCLRRANVRRRGYSGLMLPVLEDRAIAAATALPTFTVNSLLLYSAVCGLGLDTVPLPGDVGESELAGIILDMSTLAVRLGKPLTARLMPVPGLAAGEPTRFDFPYFANGRTLPITGWGIARLLRSGERVRLIGSDGEDR